MHSSGQLNRHTKVNSSSFLSMDIGIYFLLLELMLQ